MPRSADGEHINQRPYNYVLDWLKEKIKMNPKLQPAHDKAHLEDLTSSEFWQLFHQATNEEMSDKF